MFPRKIKIPTCFHSLEHEGPFTKCIQCERPLDDSLYFIERAFHGSEPILEMAICEACREKICEELSAESMERIRVYQEERLDVQLRIERLAEAEQSDPDDMSPWLSECVFTKKPRSECSRYQIMAACYGNELLADVMPMLVSDDAIEEMQRLMSKQTRDRLGDLVQEHFGQPSEFADGPAPLLF
ncbi:MAG TPA: hypothetical protein DDW52_13835 [Planctomycetaceae bacterium]|nr:hypothetical protein [Planctomycetaceae bacterium]